MKTSYALPSLAAILQERNKRETQRSEGGWKAEKARCADGIDGLLYWFGKHVWTYDPRLIGKPGGAYVPFKLWPKQIEMVRWLYQQIFVAPEGEREGLIEKSRDVGASYICMAVSVWGWQNVPGFKATFGSRVEDDVDKKDNPDSLFHKMRLMLARQPPELMPEGFNWGAHDKYMLLTNPETGATITGEGGINMGRGGRSTVYFLDEAARIPNADSVEAALSANTECIVWVSSVNGMGNLFARKRHSILKSKQVFRQHWRDDPRKTEEWAEAKQASFTNPATWASEYDIDYSASVEGICCPAQWVESAKIVADLDPTIKEMAGGIVGLDVGAGKARSVAVCRKGPVVLVPASRKDPDTTETALWAIDESLEAGAEQIFFDSPGVGAGVSSTFNHNPKPGLTVDPVNTGMPPSKRVWPDERNSEEMFGNLKAELWWLCRMALQRTHEHVLFLQGKEGGHKHLPSDLLSLPSGDRESDQLCLEISLVKWGVNERGKIVIERKEALQKRGIASPDYADALMLTMNEAGPNILDISADIYQYARAQGRGRRRR